jgi:hypothetical protein
MCCGFFATVAEFLCVLCGQKLLEALNRKARKVTAKGGRNKMHHCRKKNPGQRGINAADANLRWVT